MEHFQTNMGSHYGFELYPGDKFDFRTTSQHPMKEADGEMSSWMNSSFPVLCQLLDKVTSLIPEVGEPHFESSAAKALAELSLIFPEDTRQREEAVNNAVYHDMDIPMFEVCDKFRVDLPNEICLQEDTRIDDCDVETLSAECNSNDCVVSDVCLVQSHNHNETNDHGLLQVCTGSYSNVYRKVDNSVREMDHIIRNPETNLCRDAMEASCELELPGLYSYQTTVKNITFNSNRNGMDVLGLILIIVDTIYSTNSVITVNHKGVPVPLEFTPNIVKVVALTRRAFPELFGELQKLIMYSTVTSVLKKVPFKWNRCMVHVLEDLIVHPLNYINEESIEFQLLNMIVRKRAKVLFKRFSLEEEAHIFDSVKHRTVMGANFSDVFKQEICNFLITSANNCKKLHMVKNIRYKVKDVLFESYLRDLFHSY